MPIFIKVVKQSDVPRGGCVEVAVNGRKLAIFELNGGYYALDSTCPHKAGPIGAGTVEGESVFCPLHGWEFDIRTGACRNRPDRPARSYPVRLADDEIEVDISGENE